MRALVVYESMFGNTEQVARAVAEGLATSAQVDLHEVSQVPPQAADLADLIVVGGPTHALSLTRPSTRADAVKQGATHGGVDTGLREWLARLSPGLHTVHVAAFDTRVAKVRHLPGSAATKAAKLTRRLGYLPAGKQSFYVMDTPGPLVSGELERAREWGAQLATDMSDRTVGR